MKFKIRADAEIDLLTREEVREELDAHRTAWVTEVIRGVKWKLFSAQATVAGAVWSIASGTANNNQSQLGPKEGNVWAVTRLAVSGGGVVAGTDLYSVFIDDIAPSKLVSSGLSRGQLYEVGQLVLVGGSQLVFSGIGTGVAGTDVTVSGQAIELPNALAWRLL